MTTDRTFFLRRTYSTNEKYERIFSEDFIREFKTYALPAEDNPEVLIVNKGSCYQGLSQAYNGDERFHQSIDRAFHEYGRKGDKLNVKLFRLNPEFTYALLPDKLNTIQQIKERNESIKSIDHLSPGLEDDLYIMDYNVAATNLDLRFKFSSKSLVPEPTPHMEISNTNVEARIYTTLGIVALFINDAGNKQINSILNVIHHLFHFTFPKHSEIAFDEAQLIMIQLRLNGQVSSPRFRSEDDIRVDIHGLNEINYEDPIVQLVQGQSRLKIYELASNCVVEGHRCFLRLSADGRVQIETFVMPDVLDKIIQDIEWVILSKEYYKELYQQVDELFKGKSPGSLATQRKSKIDAVTSDLHKLLEKSANQVIDIRKRKLVTTILFNVGIFLTSLDVNRFMTEVQADESADYGFLISFITDYQIMFKRKNRSDSAAKATLIVSLLQHLCTISGGDAVSLIEQYRDLTRE